MARCILLMTRVATDHNMGFTTCKRRALKDLAWKLAYLKRQVRSGGATGTPDATVRARANQRLAQGTMVSVLTWSLALRPVWSVLCLGRRVGSNDTSSIGWQAKSAEAAERYKDEPCQNSNLSANCWYQVCFSHLSRTAHAFFVCTWLRIADCVLNQSVRSSVRCRRVDSSPKPRKPERPRHFGPEGLHPRQLARTSRGLRKWIKVAVIIAKLRNPRTKKRIN